MQIYCASLKKHLITRIVIIAKKYLARKGGILFSIVRYTFKVYDKLDINQTQVKYEIMIMLWNLYNTFIAKCIE